LEQQRGVSQLMTWVLDAGGVFFGDGEVWQKGKNEKNHRSVVLAAGLGGQEKGHSEKEGKKRVLGKKRRGSKPENTPRPTTAT